MINQIGRDSVAPLMFGDQLVTKRGEPTRTIPRFTDSEAAKAMQAAALRLQIALSPEQIGTLRALQGVES